jgi:hypothetical protein
MTMRLAHLILPPLLFLGFATDMSAQPALSSRVTVSNVVVEPEMARFGDSTSGVVFVVRDLFTPSRSLASASIAVGPPTTDILRHPARTGFSDAKGEARIAGLDGDTVDVAVRRIGYAEVRFTLRLARGCGETIEVYLRSSGTMDGEVRAAPPSIPRVVRTTCTPPP